MEICVKVGNKRNSNELGFLQGWREGQIVDIREDGFHKSKQARKSFCIIETPDDFWALRGSTDWKSTNSKVYNLKKYLSSVDSIGKYKWEAGALKDEKLIRLRDNFIDFKYLLNEGLIDLSTYESIYDKNTDHKRIYIEGDFKRYIFHEDIHQRIDTALSEKKGSISSDVGDGGPFSIGSGLNYDTVTLFEADIAAQLTGNLTGEHADEETAINASIFFNTDTNGFLLKLTAASGAEHNGSTYGNGARVNMQASDYIAISEGSGGTLNDIEFSKFAMNIEGSSNKGFWLINGGDTGLILINRVLITGDGDSLNGIDILNNATNVTIRNSIIYGIGNASGESGIKLDGDAAVTWSLYNNTIVSCYDNISQAKAVIGSATLLIKNNLTQGGTNADWADTGAGFGTSAFNISEDGTSPNAAYQNKDVHTNSVFKNYAGDDYRLDPAGDVTNLAILDDGEDLSGTFTDDIEGQTRSTWYIGASEIVGAGPVETIAMMTDYYNRLRRL